MPLKIIKKILNKNQSEYRKDYLLDQYVIVTPGRAGRPRDISEQTILKKNEKCVFCPENILNKDVVYRIGDVKLWEVISKKNTFPTVTIDNAKAYGIQEVIIETPDHAKELGDLSLIQIEKVLKMYAQRTSELSHKKNIQYVECFKNQGSKAGASLTHAHSQVFATDVLPPLVLQEIDLAKKYKKDHDTCPYCDIIKKEMKGARRIWEDSQIAVFAPYASRYHYEVWIFTKRHIDNIAELNPKEFKSLAIALKMILTKLKTLGLAFNYFMNEVVSIKDEHFFIKLQPRDSVWAGLELGSGMVVNSVPPEDAAKFYRGDK